MIASGVFAAKVGQCARSNPSTIQRFAPLLTRWCRDARHRLAKFRHGKWLDQQVVHNAVQRAIGLEVISKGRGQDDGQGGVTLFDGGGQLIASHPMHEVIGDYQVKSLCFQPGGDGFWPAFWMLGTNYDPNARWPHCGEIDIPETRIIG